MNARIVTLVGALALGLAACPPPTNTSDAGDDSGYVDPLQGPCTGGCGPLQKCDEATHQCVDGCGGCGTGVCTKNAAGAFQCVPQTTTCNGSTCSSGQVACMNGTCSCLPFDRASLDTCAVEGSICKEAYNQGTGTGGLCAAPKMWEACKKTNCPSGACAVCPSGSACAPVFGDTDMVCARACPLSKGCLDGETCWSTYSVCLPNPMFDATVFSCADRVQADGGTLADGGVNDAGTVVVAVAVSNKCLIKDGNGDPIEQVATGNCTYDFFRLANQVITVDECRRPGGAVLNGTCQRGPNATLALSCGTGLECAITRGDTGQCLKMCNAVPERHGIVSQPACGTGEACVNLYRLEDLNAVVGVCVPTCDVFSTTAQSCADFGTVKASCVPVPADGVLPVSQDGKGICVPQKAAVAAAGEACAEPDSFKGASCATGLLCRAVFGADQPTCWQPCDTGCNLSPKPARCATEPNATCTGGKTCTKLSGATGVTMGVCK